MDNYSVSVESSFSLSDYTQSYVFIISHKKSYYVLFGLVIIGLLFVIYFNRITSALGYIPYIAGLLLGFFLVYFYPLNRLKKQFKYSDKMREKIIWNIDNNNLEINTEDITDKYSWNEFRRYYNGKKSLFFQLKLRRNQYKIIPKRVFSKDQLAGFLEMLKNKTKNSYFL